MNHAAEAAHAAFREIGEHLVASERGELVTGRALGQDKLSMERRGIELALQQAKGSVSEAARTLGTSWQWLAYALNTRHKDLLKYRTPAKRRARKK